MKLLKTLFKPVHYLIAYLENVVDAARYHARTCFGISGPYMIETYDGYVSSQGLHLRGRVLKKQVLPQSLETDSRWKNLRRMIRRWITYEIPHARLRVHTDVESICFTCDGEGYFHTVVPHHYEPQHDTRWESLRIELEKPVSTATAEIKVLIPGHQATTGIISDVDDTVLVTGAARFWLMLKTTLLNNRHTRKVFADVDLLYQALQKGSSGRDGNPFFYVTSSPWNLATFLKNIFNQFHIPRGPMFMKDWGLDNRKFIKSGHYTHKVTAIENLLDAYPRLSFILLGDSGQMDPEIYIDLIKKHRDRIRGVYIRQVSTLFRQQEIEQLAQPIADTGVQVVVSDDSLKMLEHARQSGWACSIAK